MKSSTLRLIRAMLLAFMVISVSACATITNSPNAYADGEAMQASATLIGVVVNVRPVQTRSKGDIASAYGALLGAVALSRFGTGSGRIVSALAGAGIGAGIGGSAAKSSTEEDANEIIVRLPTKTGDLLITVVQGSDLAIKKGMWVYVIATQTASSNGWSKDTRYRVVPAT